MSLSCHFSLLPCQGLSLAGSLCVRFGLGLAGLCHFWCLRFLCESILSGVFFFEISASGLPFDSVFLLDAPVTYLTVSCDFLCSQSKLCLNASTLLATLIKSQQKMFSYKNGIVNIPFLSKPSPTSLLQILRGICPQLHGPSFSPIDCVN